MSSETINVIRVNVQMESASQPIPYVVYQMACKNGVLALYIAEPDGNGWKRTEQVVWHPLCNIFRVVNEYGYHGPAAYES